MDRIEAKILLKNLLRRIKPLDEEQFELSGVLTDGEVEALHYVYGLLEGGQIAAITPDTIQGPSAHAAATTAEVTPAQMAPQIPVYAPEALPLIESTEAPYNSSSAVSVELDLSIFDLPEATSTARLCMDFGTAMSKATLVINDEDCADFEDIHVMDLGIPGDQRDVSDTMLISSVYIDNAGLLWFGKNAVDRSLIEGADGERMRVDNVKRYLSEGAMRSVASATYNPTSIDVTGSDFLLAYLMFMTWTTNVCVAEYDLPRNIKRRFAMPCFSPDMSRDVANKLRRLLGEAQILADTFGDRLHVGLPLIEFMEAVRLLHEKPRKYDFVTEHITEPLGVANSLLSNEGATNSVTLIVDIGAGTSDMSLYRLHLDSEKKIRQAFEVDGAARGIQRAGNYLDKALIELILKKADITSQHPRAVNIRCALELTIREYKESLFNNGFFTANLLDGQSIEIELEEFEALRAVQQFSQDLEACLKEVLSSVDESWLGVASSQGLAVVLTGGGAKLPMVMALSEGPLEVQGRTVQRIHAPDFPKWLKDEHPELEDDFPRIAVSLGGARRDLIAMNGKVKVTAGDVRGNPSLSGYYSR